MTEKPQNTSNAVMATRVEPSDSLDDFPTPPWATRALMLILADIGITISDKIVWEPACGRGSMAEPLREHFGKVIATDIRDYGYPHHAMTQDFLKSTWRPTVDWIITNPPFRRAASFADRALYGAREGVALFTRLQFLEGGDRWRELFQPRPPTIIAPFVERVPIHKGKLTAKGSTATAYVWSIWVGPRIGPTIVRWIAPCRKRLERPGDYDNPADRGDPVADVPPGRVEGDEDQVRV